MRCPDGKFRRVVTLEVEADASAEYAFHVAPLADPLLAVEGSRGVGVDVDLSADGSAFAGAWGVRLGAGGAVWRVPRSAAAIRVSASGGPATFTLAVLEAA